MTTAKAFINKGTEGHYDVLEVVLVFPLHYLHGMSHSRAGEVHKSQAKTLLRTSEHPNYSLHEGFEEVDIAHGIGLWLECGYNPITAAYNGSPFNPMQPNSIGRRCCLCGDLKYNSDYKQQDYTVCKTCIDKLDNEN